MGKTVELDDRDEIAGIVSNPDVEIRIKDAVADAVAKSVSAKLESTIQMAVRNEVEAFARPVNDNGIFAASTPDDVIGPRLSKSIRDEIVRYLKLYVNETIHDAVEELDISGTVRDAVKNKVESIRNYDIESAVRSEAKNLCRSLLEIVDGHYGKESGTVCGERGERREVSPEADCHPSNREEQVKWIVPPMEMEYDTEHPRSDKILAYGSYRDVEIMVVGIRGSHMCGFARVDGLLDDSSDISSSELAWVDCHGGVTFVGNGCHGKKGLWIGWSYGHDGDFVAEYHRHRGVLMGPGLSDVLCGHKWTTEEVVEECLWVVDQFLIVRKKTKKSVNAVDSATQF